MTTYANRTEEQEKIKSRLLRTTEEKERQELIKTFNEMDRQLRTEAVTQAINRKFQAVAVAWAQCSGISDFNGSCDIQAVFTIDTGSGDVAASVDDINLSSSGRTVTIHQTGNGQGHYDAASGNLDLRLPLHVSVKNLPVIGNLDRDINLPLSTHNTVQIPGRQIGGSPATSSANATGAMTLVGGVSVNIFLFVDAHVQIQMIGTLSDL